MASTYTRADSPFIHVRTKGENGKWSSQKTGFRKDNIGDRRQAELLSRRLTEVEHTRRASRAAGDQWEQWVERFLHDRYGARSATMTVYRRYWRRIGGWLVESGITSPSQMRYAHALDYRDWRADTASINTTIHELKFLSVIMGEAVKRGFATGNPFLRLGLRRDKPKEKHPWTDDEIATAGGAIGSQSHFLRASFLLGLYQAARLRQCCVPLSDVDLVRGFITYRKTKGDKPFTQPLDPKCIPLLAELIAERRAIRSTMLCEIPVLPSVEWRQFLDSLGLTHLVHHGLRVTWVTRAAISARDGQRGVSLAEAKRFVNHGSTSVHEIYQRLNADDLVRVPAAMNLPALPAPVQLPPKRKSGRRSSD